VATILKIFLYYRLTNITVNDKLTRLPLFHLKSVMLELDPHCQIRQIHTTHSLFPTAHFVLEKPTILDPAKQHINHVNCEPAGKHVLENAKFSRLKCATI